MLLLFDLNPRVKALPKMGRALNLMYTEYSTEYNEQSTVSLSHIPVQESQK